MIWLLSSEALSIRGNFIGLLAFNRAILRLELSQLVSSLLKHSVCLNAQVGLFCFFPHRLLPEPAFLLLFGLIPLFLRELYCKDSK